MEKFKVMVPVDFTPVSYKALQFLGLLLDATPIETHLVHVVQVNAAAWAGATDASDEIDREELRALEQKAFSLFNDLKQHVDFTFESKILFGGITTSLAAYAVQLQPDLVVLGTEGADGWLEKISGSDAQHVVRHLEVPVISIQQHATITPIHNILWASDFKAEKQPASTVATIKALQQLFGAQLHLLRIIAKADAPQAEAIKENMERFARKLQLEHYQLHLRHDYQVPAGVRNFNQESEMDLVVVGTHARKGFSHIFYGSIAETLVNHCIRPLFTYHLH